MAADDWVERHQLLAVGQVYRVLRDVQAGPDAFAVGEKLTLRRVGYSPYDNSHVYEFAAGDEVSKSYFIHRDDPADQLSGTFERL